MYSEVLEDMRQEEQTDPTHVVPEVGSATDAGAAVWAEEDLTTALASALLRAKQRNAATAQEDLDIIQAFFNEVSEAQQMLGHRLRTPESIHPSRRLPCRLPWTLPPEDNRFAIKSDRVFVCDGCGNIVSFSSLKRKTTYSRFDCDFAGSYFDSSWKDIPGLLQQRAWALRLIDATWFCSQVCDAPMTGVNPDQRLERTDAWKRAGGPDRKRRR